MQPGLSRAIPMAILGFLFGSLVVIVLRFLQNLDPIWDVGAGIVVSVLFTAGFFVWGMGGFDPKNSAHGEEAEHHAPEPANAAAVPTSLLGSAVWTVTTLVLVVFGAVWGFALIPGGFTLQVTDDPMASVQTIGTFVMEIFGREIVVSELVVFAVFMIVMIGTLAVVGGGLAWLFYTINRGLLEGRAAAGGAPAGTVLLTSPAGEAPANASPISLPPVLRMLITAVVTFVVVYFLFNALLLPATISHAPEHITGFSLIFAVLAVIFVARPSFVPKLIQTWALILFLFGIFYFIFYEVAIGMVINEQFNLYYLGILNNRILISLVNALLFAVLIVRASWVVWFVGAAARVTLFILRGLPRWLFQR